MTKITNDPLSLPWLGKRKVGDKRREKKGHEWNQQATFK